MKNVLIALDYGPTAQQVAEAGFSLAKALGANVVLLHVITEPVNYSSPAYSPVMGFGGFMEMDYLQPDITDTLKKASQAFLDKSKEHLGDEAVKTLVKDGDAAEKIIEAANELQANVIVLGSHSRKWLEAILMGSVTEKVLRHTAIPLYIIPTKKQD